MLSKYNFRWLYVSDFIDTTDYYAQSLREKVLPAFGNISEEVKRAEKEAEKRLSRVADPEWFDPADIAEQVIDAGVSFYVMAEGVVQGIVNMFTVGLYHLFEQQLFRLHRQQLLFGSEERNPDLFNIRSVQQRLFQDYKIDIFTFRCWGTLQELQLVANTVKHADGRSCTDLKQCRPDLFRHPSLKDDHDPWPPDILSRIPVYEPLAGEDLYITPEEFKRYVDTIKQFWEELATAVEELPY